MQVRMSRPRPAMVRGLAAAIVASAGLVAGACSSGIGQLAGLDKGAELTTATTAAAADPAAAPLSELDRAIQHWGKQFAQNPRDLKAALAYAKNLKANGQKAEALAVVQAASIYHGNNRELAGEYGRLALEAGQVQLAQKLLAAADDPAKPDWRIVSARGTALAKEGKYAEAIPYYERALKLAPERPSILSNLALAYAAQGEAAKAEPYLRRAAGQAESEARVHQNLALVLSLQGKYEEAKAVAGRELSADTAAADVAYMQKIARVAPKPASPALAQAKVVTDTAGAANAWAPKLAQSP
jgi:Flp pilus assembly protein TadD